MVSCTNGTRPLHRGCKVPSKSPAQHRLMEAVAHSPKFAKKVGIPTSVGKEFAAADKKMKGGGKLSSASHRVVKAQW